jgi:membrane protease YdiL (CAAX protease family)
MPGVERVYPQPRGLVVSISGPTTTTSSIISPPSSKFQGAKVIKVANENSSTAGCGRTKAVRVWAVRLGEEGSKNGFKGRLQAPAPLPTSRSDVSWEVAKTVSLVWSIILPVGYGAIPLASKATGNESFAAFAGELIMLSATTFILSQNGYLKTLNANFKDSNAYAVGIIAALLALFMNQLMASSSSGSTGVDMQAAIQNSTQLQLVTLYLASAILAPLSEELLYRGYLLSSLRLVGMKTVLAVPLSALLFAIAHLQVPAVPQLFLVGVCLGSAVSLSNGNIASSIVGHALYNSLLFLNLALIRVI